MLDELGIVLTLQDDSVTNFARYIAMHESSLRSNEPSSGETIKRYSFSNVYRPKPSGEDSTPELRGEASFDIVHQSKGSLQSQLVQECELLTLCAEMCRQFQRGLGAPRFELTVSSSEVVDTILEECQVPLEKRATLVRTVAEMMSKAKAVPEIIMTLRKQHLLENNTG